LSEGGEGGYQKKGSAVVVLEGGTRGNRGGVLARGGGGIKTERKLNHHREALVKLTLIGAEIDRNGEKKTFASSRRQEERGI